MPFDNTTGLVETEAPVREEIALLDRMAEILAVPERWCKDWFCDRKRGAFCVLGALNQAAHGSPFPRLENLNRYLISVLSAEAKTDVHVFNDFPSTTHADVLDLIARTRKRYEHV